MRLLTADQLPTHLPKVRVVDTETFDPFLKRRGPGWAFRDVGEILGIGTFCPELHGTDHPLADGFYIPLNHAGTQCLPVDTVMNWASDVLYDPTCQMIFTNAEYDLGWFHRYGVQWNGFVIDDVQVQAPLINEHRFSFSLEALCRELSIQGKSTDLLYAEALTLGVSPKDVMTSLAKMSGQTVGTYCVDDCIATWKVFEAQLPMMKEQDLESIYQLEVGLIPYMIQMRMRGVRIDEARCAQVSQIFLQKEKDAHSYIKTQTGINIEKCFSADQVSKILDHLGIPYPLTPKTQKPSMKKDYLEGLPDGQAQLPLIRALLNMRKFNKARTTFTEGHFAEYTINGRVHTNFNLLKGEDGGTISGRLSADSPPMQQIPARDPDVGPAVRSIVLPEEGCVFASLDYSQQEPRGMVDMAYRIGDASATNLRQQFIDDATTDFHTMNAELTGLTRKQVKNIGLGLAYGMGGGKLAKQLGLPYTVVMRGKVETLVAGPEATALLNKFHSRAPYIRNLGNVCKQRASSRGFITTPLGRKIHFPMVNGEIWKAHKSLNGLIQGMAADETKAAMLASARAGFLPSLQVHDELNYTEFETGQDAAVAAQIMLDAVYGCVPSKVDVEIGPSWGECELIHIPGLRRSYMDKEGRVYDCV